MADETTGENSNDAETRRTAEVVCAYVSNNPLPTNKLPDLIESVFSAFRGIGGVAQTEKPAPLPAVNPKGSVKPDHIVCLDCGKRFKTLKRHIYAEHGMTPDEYREKWNLSDDYPMVAAIYAGQRSQIAKSLGLGRKPGMKPARKKK